MSERIAYTPQLEDFEKTSPPILWAYRYEVMSQLEELGEATSADLTKNLIYGKTYISRILKSLNKRGLVSMVKKERRYPYVLTEEGKQVLFEWRESTKRTQSLFRTP